MSEPSGTPAWHWRYGIHPNVDGLRVRSLGRVELALGEALRIEMLDADPDRGASSISSTTSSPTPARGRSG